MARLTLGDDVADEGGRHMAENDARFAGAIEAGGGHEILGPERQEAAGTTRARLVQPISERMIVMQR